MRDEAGSGGRLENLCASPNGPVTRVPLSRSAARERKLWKHKITLPFRLFCFPLLRRSLGRRVIAHDLPRVPLRLFSQSSVLRLRCASSPARAPTPLSLVFFSYCILESCLVCSLCSRSFVHQLHRAAY